MALRMPFFGSVVILGIVLTACSDSPSAAKDAPPTSELAGNFHVRATEGQISVIASIGGPDDFIRLNERDHLVAEIQGKRIPLEIADASEEPFYAAKDVAPSGDVTVSIVFERGSGAAPRSTVTLPGDFEILEAPDSVAEGDEVTIRLSREPLEEPSFSLTGMCPEPVGSWWTPARKDGATYTYKIDRLRHSESGPCELEARITLKREDGVVDPAFARETQIGIGPLRSEFHAERWRSKTMSLVERAP